MSRLEDLLTSFLDCLFQVREGCLQIFSTGVDVRYAFK